MTKEELRELKWLKKNIRELEEKLFELETAAQRTTSRLTDEPRSTVVEYGCASIVCKIIETKDMINLKLRLMYTLESNAERAIEELPMKEQLLIRLRYLKDLTWDEICEEMSYSEARVHVIHGKALNLLKGESKKELTVC